MAETTARGHKPWDKPGDPIDWTTPNTYWHDHEFCANCGWDAPGCGCPRDCPRCRELNGYCGHLGDDAG